MSRRGPVTSGPRVLVFRSCRQPQFRRALAVARSRYPEAEIWALAPHDLAAAARADGADQVVPHRAARLGLWPLGLALVWTLFRLRFDVVVVPQMDANAGAAANLYRLAWWLGAPTALVVEPVSVPRMYSRGRLALLAVRATLPGMSDGWRVLALLARASWRRRRRPDCPTVPVRPRVLHIIDNFSMGGAQIQLAELLNHTSPASCDVEVLVLSGDCAFSNHRLTRTVPISALDTGLRTSDRIRLVVERCRERQYDLVHTWLFQSNLVGAAAGALAGVPQIVTSVRSLNPSHYPEQVEWWHRPADALASRIADVVTVNAGALVADHARWAWLPRERVRVVHNGIDPAPLEASVVGARQWLRDEMRLPPDAAVVGSVGRLATEKDHATFVRMVAELRRSGADVYGVVAGDGPLREELRQLAIGLGLGPDRLQWLGARTDARRVIAALDVFVLSSRIEGFPNALLEAAMLGVPSVASDVGGVADVLGGNANLFAAGDYAAASRLVVGQLQRGTDSGATAAIRARCRRDFTADRLVSRWHEAYGWRQAA